MRVDVNDGVAQSAVREVRVDGELLKYCTYADTDENYAEYVHHDKDDKMVVVNSNHGPRPCKKVKQGVVTLVFAPGWGMDAENQYHLNGERVESRQVR